MSWPLVVWNFRITYGYLEKYVKKLVGRTDIEDALGRLDRLTQEEVRMAAAQGLKATHEVDSKVQVVNDKVQGVGNRVQHVADEIDGQKRPSSYRMISFLMNANSSHRDPATKGPQNLALSPRYICKL